MSWSALSSFEEKELMSQPQGKLRLAVLVSGGGTNLQAILDRSSDGSLNAEVVVAASDRPDACGLVRARNAGVPTEIVDYREYALREEEQLDRNGLSVDLDELDRAQKIIKSADPRKRWLRLASLVLAEQALIARLDLYQPDYVCLAGYMRLVTPYFLNHFNRQDRWRVLNIHPALLPAFPGQHGYEDTFAYGCKWGGITVHFVDEGEDSGPIIAQAVYPIWPHDDIEQVRRRGLLLEYEIYSQCINWLAADQVQMEQGPANRVRAVVTDPSYEDVLRSWSRMAFS
jgi:phosphoribosylglycinamide formyltransferase 1